MDEQTSDETASEIHQLRREMLQQRAELESQIGALRASLEEVKARLPTAAAELAAPPEEVVAEVTPLKFRWPEVLLAGLAFCLVVGLQLWVFTAGTFQNPLKLDGAGYYKMLADSFRDGHLYLPIDPDPRLLALPDPYDASDNIPFRLYDMSLYKGRYYMYFGPVPALTHLLLDRLGIPSSSDAGLVFLFSFLTALFFLLSSVSVWSRFAPGSSRFPAYCIGLSGALLPPITHCLSRPSYYEAPIVAAQSFVWLSFWLYFSSKRPSYWRAGLIGCCQVLALGARVALLPGLFLCALFMVLQWKRRSLLLLVAWALGGWALAAYNYHRFESPFNFGFTYQLSTQPNSTPGVVSPLHIGPNLLFHSLAPIQFDRRFPFIVTQPKPWHEMIPRQEQFVIAQPIVGLLWSTPFYCFLPLSLLWLKKKTTRSWFLPLLMALGGGLPALMIYNPAIRYQLDFSLVGLALSGTGMSYFCQKRPKLAKSVAAIFAVWTIVLGSLWGASGESDHFKQSNPQLYLKLRGTP